MSENLLPEEGERFLELLGNRSLGNLREPQSARPWTRDVDAVFERGLYPSPGAELFATMGVEEGNNPKTLCTSVFDGVWAARAESELSRRKTLTIAIVDLPVGLIAESVEWPDDIAWVSVPTLNVNAVPAAVTAASESLRYELNPLGDETVEERLRGPMGRLLNESIRYEKLYMKKVLYDSLVRLSPKTTDEIHKTPLLKRYDRTPQNEIRFAELIDVLNDLFLDNFEQLRTYLRYI